MCQLKIQLFVSLCCFTDGDTKLICGVVADKIQFPFILSWGKKKQKTHQPDSTARRWEAAGFTVLAWKGASPELELISSLGCDIWMDVLLFTS